MLPTGCCDPSAACARAAGVRESLTHVLVPALPTLPTLPVLAAFAGAGGLCPQAAQLHQLLTGPFPRTCPPAIRAPTAGIVLPGMENYQD